MTSDDPSGGGGGSQIKNTCMIENRLTLAGTGYFASFHSTPGWGGGGGYYHRAVSPLFKLELCGKEELAARRIYWYIKLKS